MGGRGEIGRNREKLGKDWRKVEKSICGFVEVCVDM